ncbi:TetR/AcrR family transcriptional regulator [Paracoccus sediminilitoris]|uniref:TetR/AcrR family transcriptional regulator n=1 Tax=Paracoccus sediminilitoris TaxID=2202419 RepID=UPI00272BCD56|nr:TetR/AcrR family transcriptional regulator [Paracoccus sediminilitoris]
MTTDLRDRRRRQTARDIQLAALRLSIRHGYGSVTTEAIATEAGISPRTFFNYYNNKQAAIVGEPPVLLADENLWIVTSQNPLIDDLVVVLTRMLQKDHPDRDLIRMIRMLSESSPELSVVFRDSMDQIGRVLSGLLVERLGPDRRMAAQLLGDLALQALCEAVMAWGEDEAMTADQIPHIVRQQLELVRELLVVG